ncbi:peptide chain release factor N(5)-glutamine methyltransferase [Paenibacillus turpanensis]|uniref:peptide chain release factor N(5)-glutamine methyltransferase n=1 Tax=Paenibacillus turpanensis TaxID=2689078 RepID=UPI001409B032|nr:peptide chain release factor N(5)-glutamine methyltransferase [Paenibacillus turpanensis]
MREAYARASSFLLERGVEDSGRNVELLLMHVAGIGRAQLFSRWSEPIAEEVEEELERLLMRRASGEPLQYIVGDQEFYGFPFAVSPAVLIPRPETELLVEQLLARGDRLFAGEAGAGEAGSTGAVRPQVLDIGTGSGCIAVTLAKLRPQWGVSAVDISESALEVAKGNAERLGAPVRFLHGSWLSPALEEGLRVDILVSNPPYIPAGELPFLQREVRDYEPRGALDGGIDGMDPYRVLVEQMKQLPGGGPRLVGFEVGIHQAEQVAGLLRSSSEWGGVDIVKDYAGIKRHVLAWR